MQNIFTAKVNSLLHKLLLQLQLKNKSSDEKVIIGSYNNITVTFKKMISKYM